MGEIGEYSGSAMPSSYWNNLINQSVLRLTKNIPLHWVTRMNIHGLVYYEAPYYVIRVHTQAGGHNTSMCGLGYSFGYGTYQWKAKLTNPIDKTGIYVGILERRHGWPNEGAIFVRCINGTYQFETTEQGLATPVETTNLGGEDWTSEKTFKIIWAASSVKLYIDDVLKATHSNVVPAEPLCNLFFEAATDASIAPASEPYVYFREQSFEEL